MDLNALLDEMEQTDKEIANVESEFVSQLMELTSSDEDIMASLKRYIEMMEG